jgi:hypothetical protein
MFATVESDTCLLAYPEISLKKFGSFQIVEAIFTGIKMCGRFSWLWPLFL